METYSIAAAARTPRDKSRFQIILRTPLLSCFKKILAFHFSYWYEFGCGSGKCNQHKI